LFLTLHLIKLKLRRALRLGLVHLLNKGCEGGIGLRLVAEITAKSEGLVSLGVDTGHGIDLSDIDLDGSRVIGCKDLVGPGAND
jgi:hypothetical protein